jgi:hypothetical protein
LVGRVTIIISQDLITASQRQAGRPSEPGEPAKRSGAGKPSEPGRPSGPGMAGGMAAAAFRAAAGALGRALAQAQADEAAGGCAHEGQSLAYRPPPRLRDHINARDVTCRFPPCRQPAWRADLDHTLAWDDGGRTCRCNLGGPFPHAHNPSGMPPYPGAVDRPAR